MNFNEHSKLVGQHAFLSASKYAWLNYDEEKLERIWRTSQEAARGTRLHNLAASLIREGVLLRNSRKTLNMYVNDAIGYRMTPEQPLVYSVNVFGTADAISFRKNQETMRFLLRISDLKNGETPTSEKQLLIYAALFCLEYGFEPWEIDNELRIYQNNEVRIYEAEAPDLKQIMDQIIYFDKLIATWREETGR